jgi:hypothetical protein
MADTGHVRILVAIAMLFAGIAAAVAILVADPEPRRTASVLSHAAVASAPAQPATTGLAGADATVRAQYTAYRAAQPAIERSPAARRPQLLRHFLAEPALGRVLAGLAALDAAGRRNYGTAVSTVFATTVSSDSAVLHDCRDESSAGQLDVATGRRLTVGVPKTHVVARFVHADGHWLISRFELSEQPCR